MRKITVMLLCLLICLSSCKSEGNTAESDSTAQLNIKTEYADPSDTTSPAGDEKEDVIKTASFVGCGDNIIYYGTWRDAAYNAGGNGYDFKPMYENVKEQISEADIAFINQECVIADGNPESYPNFNAPKEIADDLVDIGFDVVSLANNHMLDQGPKGLYETYNYWQTKDATVIGCHEENDTGKYITYTETNGIKIAYVSYTSFTNLGGDPADYGLYASYLKYSDFEGEIKEARENSDLVIVSVHWGEEGQTTQNEEQESYAQRMADAGADVIIGHHPHVIQPVEWLEGSGGNKTLCVYSLGNFLHEQAYQYNAVGGMISFDIVKVNDGRATVENPIYTPTVCHYPGNFYGNTVYYLSDYTPELANQHAIKTYYYNSMSYDYLVNLVKTTISPEFLPDWYKS